MYFHSKGMAHICTCSHTSQNGIYCISNILYESPGLITTPVVAMCFCQRLPAGWAVAQGRQLEKNPGDTHMRPHWHQCRLVWWNITSIRPEGKNNKTGGAEKDTLLSRKVYYPVFPGCELFFRTVFLSGLPRPVPLQSCLTAVTTFCMRCALN